MGLMNYLRNRVGVVIVFCIGFAIVAFLLGDVMNYGGPLWSKKYNQVGTVDGEAIDYQEFNAQVDQTTEMYKMQMGGMMNPQMRSWAVDNVWNQYLNQKLFSSEIEKIGLEVGAAELNDLVNGDQPSPQIIQAFTNPQTGFDRAQMQGFINQVKTLPANHEAFQQWNALLDNIVDERLNQKYNSLVNNSIYVTSLEANEEYSNRNKIANFDYVLLDYASVGDQEITVTDEDYRNYYNENKQLFLTKEETRDLEYILFDANPTAQDTAIYFDEVKELANQFSESANDSLFAAVNSDTKYPFVYRKKGSLSPELDSLVFSAPAGTVVGPVLSSGIFEIAKVVDARISPDSIKARHILLNPALEGGMDKAEAKADSIKQLIQTGESFAALSIQYSTDEGSKINGGELGTFARGMMVSDFENPVFDGKKGQVLVVKSQFGVHIVKIDDVIGSSRVVKAAVIDKHIVSGKETIDRVYSEANQFFGEINKNNFVEKATEAGYTVQQATQVNARQGNLLGVDVKREMIRWAFEAKEGEISENIFETENNDYYVVLRVKKINPSGYTSLESVKDAIQGDVKNRVKAKFLAKKVEDASAGATNLAAIASKLGKSPVSVENVVFANPIIPGVAQEAAVVGTVFGSDIQKPSKGIAGHAGVYVVEVKGFVNPAPLDDLAGFKAQLMQTNQQRVWSAVFSALQEKAKIEDNRANFY